MSEMPQEIPDPYKVGLTYDTYMQRGRMVHVNAQHILVVDLATGSVMSFDWDEVMAGLAHVLEEQEKKQKIAADILAQQKAAEDKAKAEEAAKKVSGFKKPKTVEAPKAASKKAAAAKPKPIRKR